jgi:Uma2 family endonuclease
LQIVDCRLQIRCSAAHCHAERSEASFLPALLIEVLSPSNVEKDTEIKRKAYAQSGVPEYWIVRPATRDVLVYAEPDDALGDYVQSQRIASDAELVSPTLPVRAHVASFFAGAPDTTL